MSSNTWIKIGLTLIIVIVSVLAIIPLQEKINLGLDLQGGMHLVLQVDTKGLTGQAKREAPARALEVIRNRIDEFGVKEPSILLQGEDQIVVQLPGVTERERALDLLKKTAVLEFKLVASESDKLAKAVSSGQAPEGYELKEVDKEPVLLESPVLLRGDSIASADIKFESGSFGEPAVGLKFNTEGARKFARITAENVGRRLAIVLDGKVYSAPRINEAIPSGDAVITGRFSVEEAKDLALVLRVGSLPAPVSIAEERTIGPLLGKDSIQAGIKASVMGVALVFVFMTVYYLFSGFIACIALLLNLLIILGYLGMSHATLTLPGIAGIILTLGMAVDANVLINERVREELATGRPLQTALNMGYKRAFSAIFDSNLTTLIAAFFLFQFGTGPIRGFAVTLTVGLLASMFTAIVVTKTIMDVILAYNHNIKSLRMLQLFKTTNFDFIKVKNFFIITTSLLVVSSIALFFIKGKQAYGIDFVGGQVQEYSFKEPIHIDKIRESLKEIGLTEVSIQQFKERPSDILIRTSSETADKIQQEFKKAFPDNPYQILRIENVGPVVGRQLKSKAFWAVIWSLIGILIYVAFRFKHLDFAVGGIVALIHDVIIAAGALLFFNRQIDLLVITALLTIAGYSINDTIVIYDRIREVMQKMQKAKLRDVINIAINQTLSRTVLTVVVTMLVVLALFLFGGEVLNTFALALLVGFTVGCYSSIFIASPIVVLFHNLSRTRK